MSLSPRRCGVANSAGGVGKHVRNPNPTAARRARKAKAVSKLGDIQTLRERLWDTLERMQRHVAATSEGDILTPEAQAVLRLLPQIAGCYLKANEVGELEARIAALEAKHGKV